MKHTMWILCQIIIILIAIKAHLDMDHVDGTLVLAPLRHNADAAAIGATGAHHEVVDIELDVVPHLARLKVKHDRVMHLHAQGGDGDGQGCREGARQECCRRVFVLCFTT
jgi:hypothetical protein